MIVYRQSSFTFYEERLLIVGYLSGDEAMINAVLRWAALRPLAVPAKFVGVDLAAGRSSYSSPRFGVRDGQAK